MDGAKRRASGGQTRMDGAGAEDSLGFYSWTWMELELGLGLKTVLVGFDAWTYMDDGVQSRCMEFSHEHG